MNGRYTLADYTAAIINAGAYAQSNGARVANPGIGYEPANSNAAIPSAEGYSLSELHPASQQQRQAYFDPNTT